MDNTLIRSDRCRECGSEMLWTQNAWPVDAHIEPAYRCTNGHVVDPATTRQCPVCGVHDTHVVGAVGGREQFRCARCGNAFEYPR
jgi:rubrerythrin